MLYALAIKFLNEKELSKVKELIRMTILGEMIYQDGIKDGIKTGEEKGIKAGQEKGIKALIHVSQKYNMDKADILDQLVENFDLSEEDAKNYYNQYS